MFSLQGPKSEDDVADGAEAEEPGELSGYEPESDVNTMTVFSVSYLPLSNSCHARTISLTVLKFTSLLDN